MILTEDFKAISVLFVCTANVCRSPTAHGVFEDFVARAGYKRLFNVDSAGTNANHSGKPPEPRALSVAADCGYDLSSLRARSLDDGDFRIFDYIVAMDQSHVDKLEARKPEDFAGSICLLLEHSELPSMEVPDPYYGSKNDFVLAMNLIEEGCISLLENLVSAHFPSADLDDGAVISD